MKLESKTQMADEKAPVARLALSVREAAAALGVSEKSVRRLIDRGLLKPCRALRHLRIEKGQIERLLIG